MPNPIALIIDDEEPIRESLAGILEDEGFEVLMSSSGEEGIEIIRNDSPDLVFLDVCLTGIDGIEVLAQIKSLSDIPVIMISGHGNIPIAVKAMQLGAYNFLQKPLSYDEIVLMAKRALEVRRLLSENLQLKAHISKQWRLVGESDKIKTLRQQIDYASRSNSRVLITGESGTGKELIARLLHENSPRSNYPFVEVNCAAIPQELIESELFGHEKGSFTGALDKKVGKFELADKGTLFLDEIGDMSLITQSKVLRVIETQTFQRVGGNKNIKVDTRIIAATNKDLVAEVQKGTFREDLFFRLNVICINSPPLRERLEDIPLLVEHFISLISAETGLKKKEVSPEVLKRFQQYSWYGNIRELRNVVERIMIMVPARYVQLEDIERAGIFQTQIVSKENDYFSIKTLKEAKEAFERDYIIKKLKENNWNISKTAEMISVERSSLHKKIKTYDISEEDIN